MKFGSAYSIRGSRSSALIAWLVLEGATATTVLSIRSKRFVGVASTPASAAERPLTETCALKPTMIEPCSASGDRAGRPPLAAPATAAAASDAAKAVMTRTRRAGRSGMVYGPIAPPSRSDQPSERRAESPNRHPPRECLAKSGREHAGRAGGPVPGAPRGRALRHPEPLGCRLRAGARRARLQGARND